MNELCRYAYMYMILYAICTLFSGEGSQILLSSLLCYKSSFTLYSVIPVTISTLI